jgi:AcrR family transcriptional regulator
MSPRADPAMRIVRRGPGRPPGPSQAETVRARIVDEATRGYASGGYAGLSFGTVAARVGIKKATLFHYFPTKDALVHAVFDALGSELEQRARAWFDAPPASHAERLERVLRGLVAFYGADPIHARVLCHGLLEVDRVSAPPPRGAGSRSTFADFVRDFTRFIEEGITAGAFHRDRALGTIVSIGGVVLFECMLPWNARRPYGQGGATLNDRADEVVRFVTRAVAVRPPQVRRPSDRGEAAEPIAAPPSVGARGVRVAGASRAAIVGAAEASRTSRRAPKPPTRTPRAPTTKATTTSPPAPPTQRSPRSTNEDD